MQPHLHFCTFLVERIRLFIETFHLYIRGGALVLRYLLVGQRIPGSIPDRTEDPPCMWPAARSRSCVPLLMWCGSLERGYQPNCRPRHLTWVKNCEVRRIIILETVR
ncbi:hypothetical protein AVEN_36655-1 [Araneus ventricosus]|uniref:Uncharacterized protein n=1 Tax=Araneus ventricosus TaxID=182803 RepID=A0A4Y2Q7P3_ARAVE|nr:hypothetical protein AVEN_36655-1 [Araneus ventricosus]